VSLHYLVKNNVLKATIENKTTSVTTQLKKLTTGNNVFIVSVIVYSNCHMLQFLHQMFNVSALLLDDALKPATPLTKINGAINETLRQFAPLSDDILEVWFLCDGIFSDSIITYFLLLLRVK